MDDRAFDENRLTGDALDQALEECAAEPIHIPGLVQPHGVLLGVGEATFTVVRVSANSASLLDLAPEQVLGRHLNEVLPGVTHSDFTAEPPPPAPITIDGPTGPLDVASHRTGGLLVVEVEPATPADRQDTSLHRVRDTLDRLQGAASFDDLFSAAATEVRRITGYDRVLIYRFDEEWNGEVIAEDAASHVERFLGLWFPASDIPAQARALYTSNWLRLIADRDYTPAPILPDATGADGQPLDLSWSHLRSVSPVHLEYLRNMGVVSSMSVSIIDQGRLWGLISCHHTTGALRPSPAARSAVEFIGRSLSMLVPSTSRLADHARSDEIAAAEASITRRLADPDHDVVSSLVSDDLCRLTGSAGVAARIDGRLVTAGQVPPVAHLEAIVAALIDPDDGPTVSDRLSATAGLGSSHDDLAAGALVVPIGPGGGDWLVCVRPELVQTVRWGGEPAAKLVSHHGRVGPRRSFAAWTETVRGRSSRWSSDEIDAVGRIAQVASAQLLRRVRQRDALAATLHRMLLLEKLPEVPGLDLAVQYRPAAQAAIGGDWYDVFTLPDGRVAVVIGDVAGHGIGAAPVMAHLRHGLRAHLLADPGPGEALASLNGLVASLLPTDLATAVVADFDPRTGVLRVATAGHLPALVVQASGDSQFLERRGPALGAMAEADYPTTEVHLGAGDAVFLYTDGMVERRDEIIDEGLARLRAAATEQTGRTLGEMCLRLLELAPDAEDDATVLGITRPADPS